LLAMRGILHAPRPARNAEHPTPPRPALGASSDAQMGLSDGVLSGKLKASALTHPADPTGA